MNKTLKLIGTIVATGLILLVLFLGVLQHMRPELHVYTETWDYEKGSRIATEPLLKTEAPLTYWVYENQSIIFWICFGLALLIVDWKRFAYKITKII